MARLTSWVFRWGDGTLHQIPLEPLGWKLAVSRYACNRTCYYESPTHVRLHSLRGTAISMNKIWIKVTVIVSLAVICGASVWRYQMRHLSNNLRSIRVDGAQTVVLGATADLVLDASVLQNLPNSQNKAILEQ